MNGYEPCPHCGEHPSRSFWYRMGVSIAKKILMEIGDDTKKRAAWRQFLLAFRKVSTAVTVEIADFLQGACDTIDKAGEP